MLKSSAWLWPDPMRAIQFAQFGGPEVLREVEVATPEPGPRQVRVDLRAASVIPGDWKLRAGHLKAYFPVVLPKIPGRDGAGVVSEVGPEVTAVRVGDHVCVVAQHVEQGTYAEAIVRDPDSIVALPSNLDFEQGAALMHAGICAWICMVETAGVTAGMRVLIQAGAGAIGAMAVQLARHLGAHVVATCRYENIEYVRALGAHEVIAYDREDFARCLQPVDVVLDLIGGSVHARSYEVLKRGGHMVCLINTPFENRAVGFGVRVSIPRIHDSPQALRAVADLAASGILQPQICDRLPLSEAARAHQRLEDNTVTRGRLILRIG